MTRGATSDEYRQSRARFHLGLEHALQQLQDPVGAHYDIYITTGLLLKFRQVAAEIEHSLWKNEQEQRHNEHSHDD